MGEGGGGVLRTFRPDLRSVSIRTKPFALPTTLAIGRALDGDPALVPGEPMKSRTPENSA